MMTMRIKIDLRRKSMYRTKVEIGYKVGMFCPQIAQISQNYTRSSVRNLRNLRDLRDTLTFCPVPRTQIGLGNSFPAYLIITADKKIAKFFKSGKDIGKIGVSAKQ